MMVHYSNTSNPVDFPKLTTIDQLMVKAGAYFGGGGVAYDNFDPKKFAELIVRECADHIMNSTDRYRKEYFANVIKEHFGVEE